MRKILGATLLGILLIYACIQGALWQYDRHETRHAKNELIRQNVSLPTISETQLQTLSKSEVAWRKISLSGNFVPEKEILVRNRYHEGNYGFGVVTLFNSESGKSYWVDRGWVIAGKDAQTAPEVVPTDSSPISIEARVRVEGIESQVQGSVFAVPGNSGQQKLQKWNSDQSVNTEQVYLDLVSASNARITPEVPTALPIIGDGPHLAYSLQWIIFALLVVLAWVLVIREERRSQAEKL